MAPKAWFICQHAKKPLELHVELHVELLACCDNQREVTFYRESLACGPNL